MGVGHKPRGEQAQSERRQATKVGQHPKERVESLQGHKSDLKGQNLRVHLHNPPRSLHEDKTGEEYSTDAVIAGVVGVAVDHLVCGDDDDSRERGHQPRRLQNPVPAHLGRAGTKLDNG